MNKSDKIYVAGHNGMVGSAIIRKLKMDGYSNILVRSSKELDLRNQRHVEEFFQSEKPDYIFLAAAKVGGILANNTYKASFMYDNLSIQNNVIHAAYKYHVKKLLFLGSSCIYPKFAAQPIREESLLTSELEPTNEPYAIAKIAGLKMCQFYREQYNCNFISLMPANLYGPNDNFDLKNSHVLPALLRKFHEAKIYKKSSVTIWGTGNPLREFLHVNDLAKACIHFMLTYNEKSPVNIGTGKDISIHELASEIKKIVGFEGEIVWDKNKPDGTPRKLLDVTKAKQSGWESSITLLDGIRMTYDWYVQNKGK
ncbi:MAG: GDP-L-fucose synthase [Bacteroidota bacterium]|nr:GDP-L-fucose synthase [Bacteroidota bacterium]